MTNRKTARRWCPDFDKTLDHLAETGALEDRDGCPECSRASQVVHSLSRAQGVSGVDLESVLRTGVHGRRREVSRAALQAGKAALAGHPGVFTDDPPENDSSIGPLGWTAWESIGHEYRTALSAFRLARETDPAFADAGIWESMALILDGRVEDATALLQSLEPRRMDKNAAAYFLLNRSTVHRLTNDLQASRADAASSAELRPDLGAAHLSVLLVCCRQNDHEGAVGVLETLESLIQDGSESPGPLAQTLALCPESLAAAGAQPGKLPRSWNRASPSLFADERVPVAAAGGETT